MGVIRLKAPYLYALFFSFLCQKVYSSQRFQSKIKSELVDRSNAHNLKFDTAFTDRIIKNNEKNRLEYIKTHKLYCFNLNALSKVKQTHICFEKKQSKRQSVKRMGRIRKGFLNSISGKYPFPGFSVFRLHTDSCNTRDFDVSPCWNVLLGNRLLVRLTKRLAWRKIASKLP